MHSNKAKSFAKFLALAERFKAADKHNYCKVALHEETRHFQAAFFACRSL